MTTKTTQSQHIPSYETPAGLVPQGIVLVDQRDGDNTCGCVWCEARDEKSGTLLDKGDEVPTHTAPSTDWRKWEDAARRRLVARLWKRIKAGLAN